MIWGYPHDCWKPPKIHHFSKGESLFFPGETTIFPGKNQLNHHIFPYIHHFSGSKSNIFFFRRHPAMFFGRLPGLPLLRAPQREDAAQRGAAHAACINRGLHSRVFTNDSRVVPQFLSVQLVYKYYFTIGLIRGLYL